MRAIYDLRKLSILTTSLLHKTIFVAIWLFCQTQGLAQTNLLQDEDRLQRMRTINPALQQPLKINETSVAANSIKISVSEHLAMLTDIRDRSDIDELNHVFDLAVEQWCKYFSVDPSKTKDWHIRAMVIADRAKFKRAGLMPNNLPTFPAGFQRGHETWVYLQPGNYYTRHLLLHEGTHSFMQWFLGGTGAPWYTEGMAELLGIHRWSDGKLKLNYHLTDRSQAPYWGRIKLLKQDREKQNTMKLEDVLNIPGPAFRELRPYAWSWAACEFFSKHPLSKQAFSDSKHFAHLEPVSFNAKFKRSISEHFDKLERDWNLFIGEIDFGYDVAAGALSDADGLKNRFKVSSSRSWQQTEIQVQPGDQFTLYARGRFNVADEEGTPWPCEANGITIEYYRGKPLGQLVCGILENDLSVKGLFEEYTIGSKQEIKITRAGTLCLRINESPAKLSDNDGVLEVIIKKE